MRNSVSVCGVIFVLAFGLSLMGVATTGMAAPTSQSEKLTIVDVDGTKVEITAEELRKLPLEIEEECICVGESVGFIGIFDYSGVRLVDVLKKAKAAQQCSGYRKENMYLVFKGTDGYQVVASWNELVQIPEGRRALVALDKNSEPLPPGEGKFRLVFPDDKYVGRSVKCLQTIEIRMAEGFVDKKHE